MRKLLLFILPSLLLTICSFILAYNGKNGWGWFLFFAVLFFDYPVDIMYKNKDDEK